MDSPWNTYTQRDTSVAPGAYRGLITLEHPFPISFPGCLRFSFQALVGFDSVIAFSRLHPSGLSKSPSSDSRINCLKWFDSLQVQAQTKKLRNRVTKAEMLRHFGIIIGCGLFTRRKSIRFQTLMRFFYSALCYGWTGGKTKRMSNCIHQT